jgi:hypothetical protein
MTTATPEQVIDDLIKDVMFNPLAKSNMAFRMARALLAFGGEPSEYEGLIARYCQQTGGRFEELMLEISLLWPSIAHPLSSISKR